MPIAQDAIRKLAEDICRSAMGGFGLYEVHKVEAELHRKLDPLIEAVMDFGGRVEERCPSWFDARTEPDGATDFAVARDRLRKELKPWLK